MIAATSYSKDWIFKIRGMLGKRSDPKLIEKAIYALLFLEKLSLHNLNFIFKGGTSLLLATPVPKRFSIDIDIITEHSEKEIIAVLKQISGKDPFLNWENDSDRKHTADAPIGHFKLYYESSIDGKTEPILLDVLYSGNPYPELTEISINHDWLVTEDRITKVPMPTFTSILGDKLTAFAPKTTGILYTKNRPVEIIKQLFDIAFLMDNVSSFEVVLKSFNKVVEQEISFRKLTIGPSEVLDDTFDACRVLASRDTASPEFQHMELGIRNFTNFTIQKFSIEEAITAAAKVAYLTRLLKIEDSSEIERFANVTDVSDWLIENPKNNKLNKLKKNNPEAFFYWFKALGV